MRPPFADFADAAAVNALLVTPAITDNSQVLKFCANSAIFFLSAGAFFLL